MSHESINPSRASINKFKLRQTQHGSTSLPISKSSISVQQSLFLYFETRTFEGDITMIARIDRTISVKVEPPFPGKPPPGFMSLGNGRSSLKEPNQTFYSSDGGQNKEQTLSSFFPTIPAWSPIIEAEVMAKSYELIAEELKKQFRFIGKRPRQSRYTFDDMWTTAVDASQFTLQTSTNIWEHDSSVPLFFNGSWKAPEFTLLEPHIPLDLARWDNTESWVLGSSLLRALMISDWEESVDQQTISPLPTASKMDDDEGEDSEKTQRIANGKRRETTPTRDSDQRSTTRKASYAEVLKQSKDRASGEGSTKEKFFAGRKNRSSQPRW
jgi:hypothetical protein